MSEEQIRLIRANIAENKEDIAKGQISELVDSSSDNPMTLLTCASLYLTLGDDYGLRKAIDVLLQNLPKNNQELCQIASPLISLNASEDALFVVKNLPDDDTVCSIRANALHALRRNEEALQALDSITNLSEKDRLLRIEVLSSLGRIDDAIQLASEGVSNDEYPYCRAYLSILIRANRDKEAKSFAKERSKAQSADGLALFAQYEWLMGNTKMAGGYATRAIKIDQTHVGAMEYLGYQLASNHAFKEAKIVAGAINEHDPGNPAAFRILLMCR